MTHTTALPLAGRVAFVTGAGQGLGAAIARGLAEAGAGVMLADIDGQAADAVAAGLRDAAWLAPNGSSSLASSCAARRSSLSVNGSAARSAAARTGRSAGTPA